MEYRNIITGTIAWQQRKNNDRSMNVCKTSKFNLGVYKQSWVSQKYDLDI